MAKRHIRESDDADFTKIECIVLFTLNFYFGTYSFIFYNILQLVAATGLDDTLVLLLANSLFALPVQGLEALREMRVGEVIARVHPVSVHGAEILNVQLDERCGQLSAHTQVVGELVSLELKGARDDVQEELDDGVHWREGIREEKEADDDGVLVVEAKRRIEGAVVDEDREEAKDVEEMGLEAVLAMLFGGIVRRG